MRKSTRKFEKRFIRSRNAIEHKGISLARAMIRKQYQEFIDKTKGLAPSQWEAVAQSISEETAKIFFNRFYPLSGRLGVMVRNNMLRNKTAEDDFFLAVFQEKLQQLLQENAATKIKSITNTTSKKLQSIVRELISDAEYRGQGIDVISRELYKRVGANLKGNGYARARAIAQTETISASNQASRMAADSTGFPYKKFWSTSGLQGVRPTHTEAEEYSDKVGGLNPDEPYPNGLLYPGDPSGPPEEVINCRCTELHEIV